MHFYDNKNLIVDISTNVIIFSDFYIGRIKNFALKIQIMHGRWKFHIADGGLIFYPIKKRLSFPYGIKYSHVLFIYCLIRKKLIDIININLGPN